MKRLNNKGVALITAYMVLTSLLALAASLTMPAITELYHARRYRDSSAAFWAAEAGINRFLQDTTMLDISDETTFAIGTNSVHIIKDDSNPSMRVVTATGTAGGISRQIRVEFPPLAPGAFENTISSGGNFRAFGGSFQTSRLNVHDKTRLSGIYVHNAVNLVTTFDDKLESQAPQGTTLTYPDADNNGTADQFNDFVEFNRDLVASYPPEEVVYVTPADGETVVIYPNVDFEGESLVGKKIIYVEGSAAGQGDVQVWFDATNWQDNQNLTIISTGTVTYVQPLNGATENSKLNAVAWDDYSQGSVVTSQHSGVVYAHDDVGFLEILSSSQTTGNVIANDFMQFTEFLKTTKNFYYVDPLADGSVPPGFEGLIGSGSGYSSTPNSWEEL